MRNMLPILLVSDEEKKTVSFIESFIADNKFSAYDIYKIFPLKDEISINQVRELKKDLILSQSREKLIIFYDFHNSSIETQNALLKILEEDIERNQYLLITKNSERILTTIRSRTKTVNLINQKKTKSVDKRWLDLLKQIEKSVNLGFLNFPNTNNLNKDEVIDFFYQATVYFQEKLRQQPKQSKITIEILKKILKLSGLLENNNLNSQLAFDNLLIFIWKRYKKII